MPVENDRAGRSGSEERSGLREVSDAQTFRARAHPMRLVLLAAGDLTRMLRDRQFQRYRTWIETRAGYPRAWREASNDSEWIFWLTTTELEELNRELEALWVPRIRERLTDPSTRRAGALPVEMLLLTYPIALPPAET